MNTLIMRMLPVLTLLFNSASSTDRINVVEVKDRAYGELIGSHKSRSFIECYIGCSETETCQSVTYLVTSRRCDMNQGTIPDSLLTCTSGACLGLPDVKYAEKLEEACVTTIRTPCLNNGDCVDSGTECRDGICKCSGGRHHDPTTCACVTECVVYGDTFQVTHDRLIPLYNRENLVGFTEAQCLQRCVDATSYVCKTVEYVPTLFSCRPQEVTSFEQTDVLEYFTTLYTRDCAP